jgi:hypothetical protein
MTENFKKRVKIIRPRSISDTDDIDEIQEQILDRKRSERDDLSVSSPLESTILDKAAEEEFFWYENSEEIRRKLKDIEAKNKAKNLSSKTSPQTSTMVISESIPDNSSTEIAHVSAANTTVFKSPRRIPPPVPIDLADSSDSDAEKISRTPKRNPPPVPNNSALRTRRDAPPPPAKDLFDELVKDLIDYLNHTEDQITGEKILKFMKDSRIKQEQKYSIKKPTGKGFSR